MSLPTQRAKPFLTPFELVIFAVLGALMYCSKIIMEWAPNIHLLGMFTMTYTLAYRVKGLIPIYVYVFLNGLFSGFAAWWIPYLYLWAILWGVTMLLPKKMPDKIAAFVYPVVCGLHGLAFGTLYAPAQALLFGYSFKQMLVWIASGFTFDVIHGVSNVCAGVLILPLTKLLRKLDKGAFRGK
ncbi:MAG: hypothetical protein K2J79_08010 [Ruminiclostridium sp.]|nr:hypothetical protein [Ruminiclostridium sp.]